MALTPEQAYEEEYNNAFFGEDTKPSTPASEENTDPTIKHEEVTEDDTTVPSDEKHTNNDGKNDEGNPADTGGDDVGNVDNTGAGDDKEPVKNTHRFKLKIDGKDIEMDFTDEDIASGMQKSFDYTRKTQAIAEYRKTIEKMNSLGISPDDLEIFARAKSGDREALAYLSRTGNVDPLDLVDVEPLNPVTLQNNHDVIVPSQQVQDILSSVAQDTELFAKLKNAEKDIPLPVMKVAAQDPNALYAVIQEVKSGDFERVQPMIQLELMRMSEYDRAFVMNSPDAYVNLYNTVKTKLTQPNAVVNQEEKQKPTPQPQQKPNMAEVGVKRSTGVSAQVLDDAKDAWSDDETYKKMLKKVNGH